MSLDTLMAYELSTQRITCVKKSIDTLCNHVYDTSNNDKTLVKREVKKTQTSEWITPNRSNSFFWILYIIIHGIEKYNFFHYKAELETDEIFKWIEMSAKQNLDTESKMLLRKHKLNIQDIMNDLACTMKFSIDAFVCMCITMKIPVILIRSNFCIVYNSQLSTTLFHVVNYDSKELYYKKTNAPKQFVGHTFNSPLKAISGYKLNDLQEIATYCGLNIMKSENKKLNKAELYKNINSFLWNYKST